MSNISKRRKEGSKAKIKSMGDHKEFLKRITKTLYYGELPTLPCLSLPVTEISCEVWSVSQRGRSLRRLHADAAAGLARSACVSPCALVLALLYLERLNACNPDYIAATAPADLFLVSLMVGNKFLQDDGEDDEVICSEWATSGDMELNQLKKLELEFLSAINWNVFVNEKSFEAGLRWLERNVALKQARLRGFFTYSDLAAAARGAAGARGLAQLARAAAAGLALALAALASTLALLTSAVLLARLASSLTSPSPSPLAHPASSPTRSNIMTTDTAPPPLDNATLVDEFSLDDPVERPTCCTTWSTYREGVEPKRNWFDDIVVYDWKSFEPWRSRSSVLNWLYQSSLVDPMQRWLEKIDEYADIFRRTVGRRKEASAPNPCHEFGRHGVQSHCVRQWLNLSKLNALVASVSDR